MHVVVPRLPVDFSWDGSAPADSVCVPVDRFHPAGSAHRPRVDLRLGYDNRALYLSYRVADRYVLARHTQLHDMVCEDSCVECFLQPEGAEGYFNFECNCIGTLHVHYVEDPTRTPQGLARSTPLAAEQAVRIARQGSLPVHPILEEITTPVEWTMQLTVPFEVLTPYAGSGVPAAGATWRVNFFKCADLSSHPHWASWAPIGDALNFHQPDRFGRLEFA